MERRRHGNNGPARDETIAGQYIIAALDDAMPFMTNNMMARSMKLIESFYPD